MKRKLAKNENNRRLFFETLFKILPRLTHSLIGTFIPHTRTRAKKKDSKFTK